MSTWIKQPAIVGAFSGGAARGPDLFPAHAVIAVGFGYASLTKNGETIFTESNDPKDVAMTGAAAETMAAADPDHDWRITMGRPLSTRIYQRHAPGEWVLIAQDKGFA